MTENTDTTESPILGLSTTAPTEYEEMRFGDELHGLVHWVRNDTRNGRVYRAAVWTLPEDQIPYESPYTFTNDETVLVLEGALEIRWADGTTTTVREGDIISVAAGTDSYWRIDGPFKKFVVEVQP